MSGGITAPRAIIHPLAAGEAEASTSSCALATSFLVIECRFRLVRFSARNCSPSFQLEALQQLADRFPFRAIMA